MYRFFHLNKRFLKLNTYRTGYAPLILFFIITACSSATPPAATTLPSTHASTAAKEEIKPPSLPQEKEVSIKDYTIAEPDSLYISVWKEPELTATVKVRPDGKISYPLVGDIYVRGMTPEGLKIELTKRLRKYIVEPLVFVKVESIESQRVYILGAVESPKVLQLTHKTTLLEAITQAGGIAIDKYTGEEIGDTENAYISRNNIILDINFRKLLRENDMKQNIPLKPGDIINIDFKKIISGDLTHDIQMKHRDIVYVSSTTIKKWKDMSDKILSFVSTTNMAASNIISWDEASVILRGQKKR